MRASTIDAVDLEKAFGGHPAVAGASLRVGSGELVALVGPSGSGKTTLLRLIAGFEVPDAGSVAIGGLAVAGEGVWVEPDKRRIGMVFQDGALFPHLSVRANLEFGGPRAGRVEECLELVGLADRAGAFPHELSGGERQRIALARALATEPHVVLLDEPFAALDEGLRAELREEVAGVLRAAGASALLVTHNQQEALSLADVVAVMRDGRIEQVGPPQTVYGDPATRWVAEFLGDADVVSGTAADGVAECPLGRFPADTALRGPVEIVLRPEGLVIGPDEAGAPPGNAAEAVVLGRSYFGHDQLVRLELAGGLRLRSRNPGSAAWRTGDRVRVAVRGPVTVLGPS
ncbi:ABC transporter ATP-binding protein [Actinomycetospora cinnamomea]|uniref:ABC-type quaternary amine transporter n=1 Tax=Actinomycetospora cinnamomea TaxID=663609 RepID=A0A2U1EWY9_9PSEU|nr:ABC transporter ATP-binding protein [Actinomycetospora cinnamomea]PVZ04250.1 iron(III) transport system ATP-binding protein [Actinomycetospora cinnamomea]